MTLDLLKDVPKTGSRRRKIMDFIYALRDQSFTLGDYTDHDASFRQRRIKVVADFEITYWVDVPASIVMVVGVRPADRR